jgi:hypothetical protein
MRFGNPEELLVSNRQRMLQFISAKDAPKTLEYLDVIHQGDLGMMGLLGEWALQFAASLKAVHVTANIEAICKEAVDVYQKDISILELDGISKEIVQKMKQFFTLERVTPDRAQAYRDGRVEDKDDISSILTVPHHKLVEALNRKDWNEVTSLYDRYFTTARTLHDSIVLFTSVFPTCTYKHYGQGVAEKLERHSFENCSTFGPLWDISKTMTPADLAAFLAEHLRDHYAGANREGATRVIEDDEKIRLVFEPCGSGGALRLRGGTEKFPEASGMTWNRAGEVPLYCTHCARNAQHSIETFGYPKYITEFNPDPNKPCGWTIYKDPKNIPEKYFEEVGYKKDMGKFR